MKVEVTGNNPLLIHASGKVTIDGELNASGKNGTDGIGYSQAGQGGAGVAGGANGGSDGSTSCGSGCGGSRGFIQLVTHHLDTLGTLSVDGGIGGATVSSSSYYSRGGNGSKGRMYIKVYDVLNLSLAQNPSFCSTTGVAEINILGGTAPYTFHWLESNETTNPATQLPLGSNTCKVTDSNLCKSRITIVLNYDSLVQNITLCKGEQITVGNHTYTEIGSYRDTIVNVGGCYNSIITNITKFDLSVTNNNNMLQAKTGGNAYQWYNCDTDEPITDETSETFTPSKSGNYAVKITLQNKTKSMIKLIKN